MTIALDDLRTARDPVGIARLYHQLGYTADLEPVALSAADAMLEGASATAIKCVYSLVELPGLQIVHFETSEAITGALIRRIADNFLKRPGHYLLSFQAPNDPKVIFVKPSRSERQSKITRLTVNPLRPSQHECSVLKDIAVQGRVISPLEIHALQVKAFDVERVTKRFFETYRDLFRHVRDTVQRENPNTRIGMLRRNTTSDQPSLHAFTQRLLSRVLFLYFIQKKGWLDSAQTWGDGKQDFMLNLYSTRIPSSNTVSNATDSSAATVANDEAVNFYRDVLEPLFFETLNRQRTQHHSQFGRVPYLNGSLFEREYPDTTTLNLPNDLFDPRNPNSVLGVLERFNFTIEESSTLEQDVSLDPEMLGKVFENLMEADEAAASGTFYTPRSIVQFLAEESLTRYLSDTTGIALPRVQALTADESDPTDLSIDEARAIRSALEAVRVLDPAVGTASMLVGTLNVMIRIRRSAEARLGNHVPLGTPTIADWKKTYINHCLYGVDIKQEAIEIGRLRLWLSLVVDAHEPEPLPNLDYKLMSGDGVLETVDGTPFIKPQEGLLHENPEETVVVNLTAQIERTRSSFFSEENPVKRREKRDEIQRLERELFRVDTDVRIKQADTEIVNLSRKGQNRKRSDLTRELVLREYVGKLLEQKKKVLEENEPLPFFLHGVHFTEVMHRPNAGFDIVIGNPPYVSIINMEADAKKALKTAFPEVESGRADLYVYFFNKAYELLRENGRVAFITPNKFLRAGYGAKLRAFLTSKTALEVLVDFGNLPIFDAVTSPFITIACKVKPDAQSEFLMLSERTLKNHIGDAQANGIPAVRDALSAFHMYALNLVTQSKQDKLSKTGWVFGDLQILNLLEKLMKIGKSLQEIVDGKFCYGIKTGFNNAFVIDRATRDELIAADPKSANAIKPMLRGKDVRRWDIKFAERYIILVNRNFPLEEYPAIKSRLESFRDKLSNRATNHTHA